MTRKLEWAMLAAMATVALYIYYVASFLGVDMYDTYEIFLNSRLFAGDPNALYFPTRAYFFPLFLSPVFFFARHFTQDPAGFGLTASHLISATIGCGLAWMTYRLFRLHLSRAWSLFGAMLLFLNRLVIHMTPISKEDLPGALLTVTVVYFYLRHWKTGKTKYLFLTALCTFAVMATRYNVMPLVPLVFLLHELSARKTWPRLGALARKGALIVGVPVFFWLLVPTLLYVLIGRASLAEATLKYLTELYGATVGAAGTQMNYPEYPWENLGFLIRSYTPPIFVTALWGMFVAWKRRAPGGRIHGLWLAVFLAFHSFVLGHKEARYLFSMFAPLYFFAALGARDLVSRARTRTAKAGALAGLLLWPAWLAADECLKFQEPFYRENFVREVSEKAASFSTDAPVAWLGPLYAIHPQDYVFDVEDEVTYLYHMYIHQVRYYTGRKVLFRTTPFKSYAPQSRMENGVFPPAEFTFNLSEGSGLIVNLEQAPYVTKDVPRGLQPLVVERAHVVDFGLQTPTGHDSMIFTSTQVPGARLELSTDEKNIVIKPGGFKNKAWAVYLRLTGDVVAAAGFILPEKPDEKILFEKSALQPGMTVSSLYILTFDSVSLHSPAGM